MLRAGAERSLIARTCHLSVVAVDMVAVLSGVVHERLAGPRCARCEVYSTRATGVCVRCERQPAEVAVDRLQRIRALLAAGASRQEIATELEVSMGSVENWLADARMITPRATTTR
jgi:DNA-binding NarL/FixJ family response regulator